MQIKKNIPNAITCGNLLCGCFALVQCFQGNLVHATYLVGIALVLDFFDGFTARMLKVSSAIGKDLDSLADMVTFGVVPGVMMFKLIEYGFMLKIVDEPASGGWPIYPPNFHWIQYLGFIITLFSCIRLAKFNNDSRQTDSFIGVPTPAVTMVVASLPLITFYQGYFYSVVQIINNPVVLVLLTLVLSVLLVSEIPLFALKFKNFSWKDNKLPFSFLAVSVILLATLHFVAIPLVILLYILLSITNNLLSREKAK